MKRERLLFRAMTRNHLAHIGSMTKWALAKVSDEERKLYRESIASYRKLLRESQTENDIEAAIWWALQLEFSFRMLLREASDMPILRASSMVPKANSERAAVRDSQVVAALEKNSGNVTKAADELGITRQAIYKRQSNWIQGTREKFRGDNPREVVTRRKKRR